ncbi:hypothetical protein K5L04_05850 [Flavobacterium psychrophilum]|uniref:Uncharacterized protein n=1 Tax=Flavobacterium psychrophilum TaxID=96345 RepID=A0A7U2RB76_FLAPS|nr:hypothetical protein [Flavobacterium psychrophilum]EKT4498198.1 hypothetical protein [Flavobacterium psychrophilum]EKT4548494.1 hypothetical protein [Flavobacterium psychrophilum]EKT4552542.1 hypothetical protein [Flavobacterium psychrophilum]ELM3643438.1 hypothetical protein [Flavobacterium psychrophilum]ELM3649099.1 hypothetical protein [Flavobacterium psychrophilum]
MRTIKLLYILTFTILCVSFGYSQSRLIITGKTTVTKFHEQKELEAMKKGQLIDLYVERTNAFTYSLHLIGLTTDPKTTAKDLGIIETPEIVKQLDTKRAIEADFANKMATFERVFLPYVDKIELISSILFYEGILKKISN